METEIAKPSLQALIVCDMVIDDRTTGKKSIIGAFTHVIASSFPCQKPQMGVYFCITDAEGSYEFSLELVHLNTDKVVGRGGVSGIAIPDRLEIVDFGLTLPIVNFPQAGRYEFRLYANGAFIGNKDFNVIQEQPLQEG